MICNGWAPRDIVSEGAVPACATDFQCDTWRFISGMRRTLSSGDAARRLQGHNDRHKLSAARSFDDCADHRRILLHAIKRREPARLYLQTASSTEYQRKVWRHTVLPTMRTRSQASGARWKRRSNRCGRSPASESEMIQYSLAI